MTPSHIRLFDGMRVTTEHIDHLQAAFMTAVSDLRLLHSRFPVVAGFNVSAQELQITVEPGLAFDFDGQRIFCDTPQTFDIDPNIAHREWFVLAEYRHTETGEIEGQFTLVWDSCEIYLSDVQPQQESNVVVLAKLEMPESEVIVQSSEAYYETQQELSAIEENQVESDDFTLGEPDLELSDVDKDGLQLTQPDTAVLSNSIVDIGNEEEIALDNEAVVKDLADPEAEPHQKVSIHQGFDRLGAKSALNLTAFILDDLRDAMDAGVVESSWVLEEHPVSIDFLPVSMTVQVESTVILERNIELSTDESETVGAGENLSDNDDVMHGATSYQLQANSIADVCLYNESFKKMSTTHVMGHGHTRAFLRDKQLSHLPLFSALGTDDEQSPLSLQTHLKISEKRPLIEIRLVWDGDITDQLIERLESNAVVLMWTTNMAWKAADVKSLI